MLKYMLNYDVKEAGFTSLLTPPEGRSSTPKGDIRIQTRLLTRLAGKPGNTMGGAIKIGLMETFVISGCSSRPLTRLAFVGGIQKRCLGALQVSC